MKKPLSIICSVAVCTLLLSPLISIHTAQAVTAGSDAIVISEVQISSSEDAQDEFVELYNMSDASVDLTGMVLKKKLSTGSESNLDSSLSGTIPAYSFYLVAHPDYDGAITADEIYSSTSNSITNNNTIILYGNDGSTVIDKVGMGSATDVETAAATEPAEDESIERKATDISDSSSMATNGPDSDLGNSYDTDNNANDFIIRTNPEPQNTSSDMEIPPTVTVTPTPEPTDEPTPTPTPTEEPTVTPTPTVEVSTVMDVLRADDRFDTVVAALEATELDDSLNDANVYTFLAPTDDTFAATFTDDELAALLANPLDVLDDVLLNHFLFEGTKRTIANIEQQTELATVVPGKTIDVAVVDGDIVLDGTATIIDGDYDAENGMVHAIDGVLGLATPSPTPTPEPTEEPTPTPTPEPTATPEPTITVEPTPTPEIEGEIIVENRSLICTKTRRILFSFRGRDISFSHISCSRNTGFSWWN